MSKSTPLNQIPQEDDPVAQDINNVINEYLPPAPQPAPVQMMPAPQMMSQQQYVQQPVQQSQGFMRKLGLNEAINIKLVVISTVLFVVLSNVKVTSLLSSKIPFLAKNPLFELICRAIIFGILVLFAQSLFV